uniref:Complex 1 LYR protein domain-containing protein n=1 Tax=Arion vulgaris TaxID=1028688 RepID=A0A0B6ZPI1_9EUPU
MTKHSKVQQQVLSLYKQFLQVTKNQPSFHEYVKDEFRRNAALAKTDVIKIEYLLRRGWRQLDMLKTSSVSSAGVFEKQAGKEEQLEPEPSSRAGTVS